MIQLGTCTKCRGRTVVIDSKVEAFAGERAPVYTKLCPPCVQGFKAATVTPLLAEGESLRAMTELFR